MKTIRLLFVVVLGLFSFLHAATFTVTTNADSGIGSLREAMANADNIAGADTVNFDPSLSGQTITLSSHESLGYAINITSDVTVDASALTGGVTISGGNSQCIFHVSFGRSVSLTALTLVDGISGNGGSVNNDGTLTVNQCIFSGNVAGAGGAIGNFGMLTVNQCTFSGNTANVTGNTSNGGRGGGIYNYKTGILTVNQSTFSGNKANGGGYGYGGGIYSVGAMSLNQNTFSGNTADTLGGAILSYTSEDFIPQNTTLTQCTFSGNTAAEGGAIWNGLGGLMKLTHCTLSGNSAPAGSGSGVASYGDSSSRTEVRNTIIAGNMNSDVDFTTLSTNSFISDGHNLIGSGNATGNFNQMGDLINNSPNLAPLGSYGGPTQTMALSPGSPARNAATVLAPAITTDQRGFPIVGTPDIGAYEAGTLGMNYNAYIWETLPTAGNGTTTDPLHSATYDYDADGQTNGAEWAALTDPASAVSVFRITSAVSSGSNLVLNFPTVIGRNYTLQRSDDLTNGSWTTVGLPAPVTLRGSGAVRQFTVSTTSPSHSFFRIFVGP